MEDRVWPSRLRWRIHGARLWPLFTLLTVVDGVPRFVSDPPLLVPVEELAHPSAIEATQDGLLDVLDSERGALADFLSDLFAFPHEVAHRDDMIDKP